MVIILIIIAALFDLLDGRVARLLKSTSNFGMHLDLFRLCCFGTVPVLTVFLDGNANGFNFMVFYSAYVICSASGWQGLTLNYQIDLVMLKLFTGIPTPAASFLILLPMSAIPIFNLDHFKTELYISIWIT